jgi:hypothetical protein
MLVKPEDERILSRQLLNGVRHLIGAQEHGLTNDVHEEDGDILM